MTCKIFLIACEPSGDLHGAHLVKELRKLEPSLECRGLGGPKMAEEGVSILTDMTKISALGFGDVLRLYFTYRKIFYAALQEARQWKPDVLILIDSPAFNLRFAKKIVKQFPVIYYISPQIWAWGGRRIRTIKRTVDKMLVILPFEVPIYLKAGVPCEFVGHPLLDHVRASADRKTLRARFEIPEGQKAIGLLPGSRESEVRRIFPLMLESAAHLKRMLPETVFFSTRSANIPSDIYHLILSGFPELDIRIIENNFYDLLAALDFALIASGTATLEAALLGTPFFLLYKASWSTYLLGRQLIRVPYLGMVNILAGKSVVPEFIQMDIHPQTIAHEAKILLENPALYESMKEEFLTVKEKLGEPGASQHAAHSVLQFISESNREKTVGNI